MYVDGRCLAAATQPQNFHSVEKCLSADLADLSRYCSTCFLTKTPANLK